MTEEIKKEDIHISNGLTGWVHHHRGLAKWLSKLLALGLASILYHVRKQGKQIAEEEESHK